MWPNSKCIPITMCWRILLGTHLEHYSPLPLLTHVRQRFIGPIWLWKWHTDQLKFLGFQELNSTFFLVLALKLGSYLASVHSNGPIHCLKPVLDIVWGLWLGACYTTWENFALDKFTSSSVLFHYFSSTAMHTCMHKYQGVIQNRKNTEILKEDD